MTKLNITIFWNKYTDNIIVKVLQEWLQLISDKVGKDKY